MGVRSLESRKVRGWDCTAPAVPESTGMRHAIFHTLSVPLLRRTATTSTARDPFSAPHFDVREPLAGLSGTHASTSHDTFETYEIDNCMLERTTIL